MRVRLKAIVGGALGAMLVLGTGLGAAAQQELGGYTWEPLGPVTETTATEVLQIAILPDGRIILLGIQCEPNHPCSPSEDATMMTWSSDDGGATWTESMADNPWFSDVVVLGDRLLTLDDDRKVMSSADGLEWEVLADLGNTVGDVYGLWPTSAGLVVLGTELKPEEGWGEILAPHPTLWLSEDGAEWQTVEVSGPMFGPEEGGVHLTGGVVRSDDGSWLVLGGGAEYGDQESFREFALAWRGSPETGWTQHALPEEIQYGVLLGSTPQGFVAGVQEQPSRETGFGKTGLWLTRDGSDWERVRDTTGIPEPVLRAAQTGDVLVGFQVAVSFENGDGPPEMIDGSPTHATTDGRTWTDGGLLEGINVTAVAAAPDGSVLVAGNAAPCRDEPPDCQVYFPSDTERPIVMRGTPN